LTAYGLFVAVAVGLVLLYVAQYAYVAQLNLRLNRGGKQLAQIQIQNEQLEQQASELRSLRRVEEEAKTRLGMQKPETVRTVSSAAGTCGGHSGGGGRTGHRRLWKVADLKIACWLSLTGRAGLKRAFAHGVGENH